MYEANKINLCIETLREICVGNNIPIRFLGELLEKELSDFDVSVFCTQLAKENLHLGYEFPENALMINGFYSEEDGIELEIVHSQQFIQMTEKIFDNNKFEISQVIQHEMVHKYQNDVRGTQEWSQRIGTQTKEYLSSRDEMYARAHDMYLEWNRHSLPIILMGNWNVVMFVCPTLFNYMLVWGNNRNEPVLKQLMKMTYQFIVGGHDDCYEETAGSI